MPDAAAKPAEPEVPPDTDPAIRTIAMPADTNPHGDIFGGWLLCQMDLAGASVAVRRAGGHPRRRRRQARRCDCRRRQ